MPELLAEPAEREAEPAVEVPMRLRADPDRPRQARRNLRRARHLARPTEARLIFLAAAAGYLFVAAYLYAKGVFYGDSLSRVANAYYVAYSRDPHLAAIGFVWNPLPSLVLLPFLWLGHFWPFLVHRAFIGNISSAVFMAGAAAVLSVTLREMGVRRLPRLALTAAFAVHPLILIYAGNGMSEASELFTVLLVARYVTAWVSRRHTADLVRAGIALFFAYQTRYETVSSAALVTLFVAGLAYLRSRDLPRRPRLVAAITDAGLVGAPFAVSFILWALASKVIVNQWFATFSSHYGNSSQVKAGRRGILANTGATKAAELHHLIGQVAGLEPYLWVLVVLGLWTALARLDARPLAAALPVAGVFAFDALSFLAGSNFGSLRYSIATIPLACIAAGSITVPLRATPSHRGGALRRTAALAARSGYLAITSVVALGLLAPAIPAALRTLRSPVLAPQEYTAVLARLDPQAVTAGTRAKAALVQEQFRISADIDSMQLPTGSVITDVANSGPIVLASRDEHQYVITPDRDFERDLSDPNRWGIHYLLAPAAGDVASYDAVLSAFPNLASPNNGYAVPVRVWKGAETWTLYKIIGQTPYGFDQSGY